MRFIIPLIVFANCTDQVPPPEMPSDTADLIANNAYLTEKVTVRVKFSSPGSRLIVTRTDGAVVRNIAVTDGDQKITVPANGNVSLTSPVSADDIAYADTVMGVQPGDSFQLPIRFRGLRSGNRDPGDTPYTITAPTLPAATRYYFKSPCLDANGVAGENIWQGFKKAACTQPNTEVLATAMTPNGISTIYAPAVSLAGQAPHVATITGTYVPNVNRNYTITNIPQNASEVRVSWIAPLAVWNSSYGLPVVNGEVKGVLSVPGSYQTTQNYLHFGYEIRNRLADRFSYKFFWKQLPVSATGPVLVNASVAVTPKIENVRYQNGSILWNEVGGTSADSQLIEVLHLDANDRAKSWSWTVTAAHTTGEQKLSFLPGFVEPPTESTVQLLAKTVKLSSQAGGYNAYRNQVVELTTFFYEQTYSFFLPSDCRSSTTGVHEQECSDWLDTHPPDEDPNP
jgi:hypothetical protein